MRLLLTWVINAVALIVLPYIFKSITVDSFVTALLVFGYAQRTFGLILQGTFATGLPGFLTEPSTVTR